MVSVSRATTTSLLCLSLVVVAACSTDDGRSMSPPRADQTDTVQTATTVGEVVANNATTMTITAPWTSGAAIDSRYTCDGGGMTPPFTWTGAPEDTQAFGIVIENLDDPTAANWVVTNIDFTVANTTEGATPVGAVVAKNSDGVAAYLPPCPPSGSTQTFVVTVYALDSLTPLDDAPDARTMRADIEAAALEAATSVFTVTR